MPNSRSVAVDLSPSVRTVRPEPRSLLWKLEKNRIKPDHHPAVILSVDEQLEGDVVDPGGADNDASYEKEKVAEGQVVPPPSPDLLQG